MKKLSLIIFVFVCNLISSQTLGIYTLTDYLRTAIHPNGCDVLSVTGLPDDSMWVNLTSNQVMTGSFGAKVTGASGNLLLLETAFNVNGYSYDIRLRYNNGQFTPKVSMPNNLSPWASTQNIVHSCFYFVSTTPCMKISTTVTTMSSTLSIAGDFSLTALDTLKGIEITFLGSNPDLAGVYLTKESNPVNISELQRLSDEIHLYPNPASENLKIVFPANTHSLFTSLTIKNYLGQNIREQLIDQPAAEVQTDDLSPGLYEIHFQSPYGNLIKKFVKMD